MRAALQVDGEYALEPGHPAERRNSNIGRAFIVPGDFTGYLEAGHDVGSLVGIGREHPVVPNQMGFGAWHQRCQAGDEIVRLTKSPGGDFEPPKADPKGGGQDARNLQYVRGAIAKRTLQLQHHQSVTVNTQALLCDGTARPICPFLGRHSRSSLARSLTSQATAQFSENPSRAAVNGLVLAPLAPTANSGSCKRIVARPA